MVFGTLLILFSLFTLPAQFSTTQLSQAETFTVRGTVVNSATGAPIGGALVQLYVGQGPTARRSGADGVFAFEGVPAGTYTVRPEAWLLFPARAANAKCASIHHHCRSRSPAGSN